MDHAADSIAPSLIDHLLRKVAKIIQLKRFLKQQSFWVRSHIFALADIVYDLNPRSQLTQDDDFNTPVDFKDIKVLPRSIDKLANSQKKEPSLNSHRSSKLRSQCKKQSRRAYGSFNQRIEKEEVKMEEKPKNQFHPKYKASESRKKIEEDDAMKFPIIIAAKVNPKIMIKPNRMRAQSHQISLGRKELEINHKVEMTRVNSQKKKSKTKNEIQPKMKNCKDRIYINRVKAFKYFPQVMKGKSLINGEMIKRSMLKL